MRRGVENRRRIVEALIQLVREGQLEATAEQVAERAGVSSRSVFRHFADMESLYAKLSERIREEIAPLVLLPTPEGSLEDRVRILCERRAELYERIAPFQRAGVLQRTRSPFLQRERRVLRHVMREILDRTLPERTRLAAPLREGVELLASFESWDRLRSDQLLGRERAAQVMEDSILALLESHPGD